MSTTDSEQPSSPIDVKTFWSAIAAKPSAVAVVTAADANGPAGFMALSVAHLSADPPIVTVSIDGRTSALATVRSAGHFAVNYLVRTDEALANDFSGRTERQGADRFEPTRWTTLATGAPILADSICAFDCRLEEMIERNGSVLALGRLVDVRTGEGDPLLFFRNGYR
ncbi:flavin reductase family protein [Amorphus sp. 3PC139-8]|uniref:flavin reductase family protein n=1 Tax=Amorphus sp. 3PC139-8 TaxID=2735676 RepID=UPI00345CD8A9